MALGRLSLVPHCAGIFMAATLAGEAAAAPSSIEIPRSSPFPESVIAASDGTLFVSSISNGGVLRIAPGHKAEPFVKPGDYGTGTTFGVNVETQTGTLWVCSNQTKEAGLKQGGGEAGSFIKAFDIKSGKGKASYKFPGDATMCNDIAFAPDGSVYVTNTLAPQILRLKPGADALEVWATDPAFKSLDGIAFGPDGDLYVNTYSGGELFRIEDKGGVAGKITKLATSRPLTHPDGLKPIPGGFVMVEGAGPLDRVTLSGDSAKIDTLGTFAGPTGVTVHGDTIWVAEGQLSHMKDAEDGKPLPSFQLRAASLKDTGPGITLPPGFTATLFADKIGHARHMAVAADGTVYVNTWSGVYYNNDKPPAGGFVVALKDKDNDGGSDVTKRFGESQKEGSAGGTGIGIYDGKVYYEINDRIESLKIPADGVTFTGKPDVIVSGMPLGGDHPMHPFIIGPDGAIYVDMGSATNSCQPKNRMTAIIGTDPCVELETRGGVWKYDARKTGQKFSPAERYATGLRNGEGFSFDADGKLFVTQHGRDQLSGNWGKFFTDRQSAELPSEEIVQLTQGGDYGWPYCYYDPQQGKLMLAPEYGGDGRKTERCDQKTGPVAAFPAHWAPNGMVIYQGANFPKAYQGGAFIAFHGSWNRAPLPQGGYNIVFQPMANGKASGDYVVFADGFAGAIKEPGKAAHRPSGVAVGPDGALYISDDTAGRIWRVTYSGDPNAAVAAAPTPPDARSSADALPPEGIHPDAGAVQSAGLKIPPGSSAPQVARGKAVFDGEAGGTCGGCHGGDGSGGPIGPDLTAGKWLWATGGSLDAIKKVILAGVPKPKEHTGAMPPKGGVDDLSDDDVQALAAYVWAISRHKK